MWTWLEQGGHARFITVSIVVLLLVVLIGRRFRPRRDPWAEAGTGPASELEDPHRTQRGLIRSVAGWVVFALLVAAGAGTGLLWLFGWPRLPPAATFDTSQFLDLLKIALAVVAGLGGVVLLAVNLRKQRVTEAQHDLARGRDEREKDLSYNERFTTAVEQLAHENAAVRLAGVYAMAALADVWRSNRQTCINVLTGYLRLPNADEQMAESKVRETLLGSFMHSQNEPPRWWGGDLDLAGAHLDDVDFRQLGTGGYVRLDNARIGGEYAILGPETRVSFTSAVFRAAYTYFDLRCTVREGVFEGGQLVFDGERVEGDEFTFIACTFTDATIVLTGSDNGHGDTRFRGCGFRNCTFDFTALASSSNATSSRTSFIVDSCTLNGCTFDLRDAIEGRHTLWLSDSELQQVGFVQAESTATDVKRLNVRRVTLEHTVLPERHVRYRDAQEQNSTSNSV